MVDLKWVTSDVKINSYFFWVNLITDIKMKKITKIFILSTIFLVSCNDNAQDIASTVKEKKTIQRDVSPLDYSQGQKLYQKNCASCHGRDAEGAPNWRTAQGINAAPPLNGTGHTWHHSTTALLNVINNGTGKIGGSMPAWKDSLSDNEINLILVWIKAQWSDDIYAAWYNRNEEKK